MKNKRKSCFSKSMMNKMVADIKKQIKTNEGKLFILERFEEIPYEIRHSFLKNLTAFHMKEMAELFNLIKMEYGKEMEDAANRALNKMKMAGVRGILPADFSGSFIKAYISQSRHSGRVTLDIAWDTGKNGIHLQCFYLTFNPDGIYSFYFIDNMPFAKFQQYIDSLNEVIEISYPEVCYLVSEAYGFNVRFMSRPALGKFLYNKYLDGELGLSAAQQRALIKKTSKKLTCRQQINSFFHALKNRDYNYLSFCLSEKENFPRRIITDYFDDILDSEVIFLEGQAEKIFVFNKSARVTGYSIIIENNRFYKSNYTFHLTKDKMGTWVINRIEKKKNDILETNLKLASFDADLFCRVYEIFDLDELFNLLDRLDNLRIIQEIPYGVHMRVTRYHEDFNRGISFFSGVISDIVINANEFIVFSRELSNLKKMHNILYANNDTPLDFLGEYQIGLLTAFRYMEGQYVRFDDVIRNTENNYVYEDGMCFLCARYLVKDPEQAYKRLIDLNTIKLQVCDGYQIFYQIEKHNDVPAFFAEYILGPNWITISTFGDQDMNLARKKFEEKIYDSLEFNGIEIREEGIFEVLTADIKKEYPDLEATLKEIYLNKWFNSRLAVLRGMSPSEACKTEEGSRLLWAMFKKLNQRRKHDYPNFKKDNIGLKEYFQKVESKIAKKH